MNIQSRSPLIPLGLLRFTVSLLVWVTVGAILSVKAQNLDPVFRELAQSPTPVTQMTPINANKIAVQINEGEFSFKGTLRRNSGNIFIAEDQQVRVIYDRGTSHVVVINKKTGTEFYNYVFSSINEGKL